MGQSGVFNHVSKRKGWGCGGDEISFLQHPQGLPVNQKTSHHHPHKSSSSLDASVTFCFLTYLHLFLILRSCSSVNVLQILQGFSLVTQGWAVVMCQKEDKIDDTLMTWACYNLLGEKTFLQQYILAVQLTGNLTIKH